MAVLKKISQVPNITQLTALNSAWNANGGGYRYDLNTHSGVLQVSNPPSFVGAAKYDAQSSNIFAKITPAVSGNSGGVYTQFSIIRDSANYAAISYGGDGLLRAVAVSDNIPENASGSSFPIYNSVTHKWWKIEEKDFQFIFYYSPNSTTWTEFARFFHSWTDYTVTAQYLSGFNTESESSFNYAYLSNVNVVDTNPPLSSTLYSIGGVGGTDTVTDPSLLSATISNYGNARSSFHTALGLQQGGVTDFSMIPGGITNMWQDAVVTRLNHANRPTVAGGASFNWSRSSYSLSVSSPYRDGTYFQKATGINPIVGIFNVPDQLAEAFTNVQVEKTPGLENQLSVNASYYTDSCCYIPNILTSGGTAGSTTVTRSKDQALAGDYSGKVVYGGTPITDADGRSVYYSLPAREALVPISGIQNGTRGTVWLNTARASTQWYAALVLYDSNFNILSSSTFSVVGNPKLSTHPGGSVWKSASVSIHSSGTSAAYAAVVPVVVASGAETVYQSGHFIKNININFTTLPTTFASPQELAIELKADRVNLIRNPSFYSNTNGWTTVTTGTTIVSQVTDNFNRSVSNAWGTADVGGSWTVSGTATDYSVNGSQGVHSLGTLNTSRRSTITSSTATEDMYVSISTAVLATGDSIYAGLVARSTGGGSDEYRARIEFTTAAGVVLSIRKSVASVDTQLGTFTTGLTHTVGVNYRMRFQAIGSTLRAKAWLESGVEPANWQISVTDSSIVSTGSVGTRSIIVTGNTNTLPVLVRYDNLLFNGSPVSIQWDNSTGYNSLGSQKVSVDVVGSGVTGGSTAILGTGGRLAFLSTTQYPIVESLKIGQTYTVSAYVKQSINCPDITMDFQDANLVTMLTVKLSTIKNNNPNATLPGGWVRMFGTFVVPPNSLSNYRPRFSVLLSEASTNAPFSFWIDSIMVEESSLLGDYFDGGYGSTDYQWEKQGSNEQRSYYYNNYSDKLVRINQIIPEYAPIGYTYTLTSAQSP